MRRRLVLFLASMAFAAFAAASPLSPPTSEVSIYVFATKAHHMLQPNSAAHSQLVNWVSRNQSGWSRYLATPPAQGIVVRGSGFDLQVLNTQALASTPDGIFVKSITAGELAFLEQ